MPPYLPGSVRPLPGARPDALDLGLDVDVIDGRGHEGNDGQRQEAIEKPDLLGHAAYPDEQGNAEDDQPDRLGLLAGCYIGTSWMADGVNEGPRLDHECRAQESIEKVTNGGVAREAEH